VGDTAANVTAALATLESDVGHIASISVRSGGPVTVSATTGLADQAALDKIVGGFTISDSLPEVVANLSALDGDPNIESLDATSGSATLGVAIAAPAFALTGSSTKLTVAKNLAYSGSLTKRAGSTVNILSGDILTLSGTTALSGQTAWELWRSQAGAQALTPEP
jgi:hypothetical protein